MSNLTKVRPSHLRAVRAYLVVIVTIALVLFVLSLLTLQQHRQTIKQLSLSNLRLSGESLAVELERYAWQLAGECLRDGKLKELGLTLGRETNPEKVLELRGELAEVRKRHPIARHFFVLQGTKMRFPQLETPAPRRPNFHLTDEDPRLGRQFAVLFVTAETEEVKHQRPDRALPLYRQSYELQVSDELKALSLVRIARCLLKVKQPTAAARAYHQLQARYGGQCDESYRPYALVAALELDKLTGRQLLFPQDLIDIYQNLIGGRWQLSAEQTDHFLTRLEQRLGKRVGGRGETEYLNHFAQARAVEKAFRTHGSLRSNQIQSQVFSDGNSNFQTYYVLLPAGNQQACLLGFSVDLKWLEGQLLAQCRSELEKQGNLMGALGIALRKVPSGHDQEPPPDEIHIPFKTVLPFWELYFPTAATQTSKAAALREMLFVGGAAAMMLCVLSLGTFLLLRVLRRLQLIQLRSDFVSGVSHELKTPLALIRLYGETMLDDDDLSAEERRSCLQVITRESERLSLLIENVLGFSSIEGGQGNYKLVAGDLAPVIAKTVEVYGQWLTQRKFTFKSDIPASLPLVRFDSEKVCQAVLNLMDNARKYSGESKSIRVRLWTEDDRVILEVEDRGIGIPADEHQKIFQQFYRAHKSGGQGGCGLGLFLVNHIMKGHGGDIKLESEVGRGSRFRLIFPVWQPVPEDPRKRGGTSAFINRSPQEARFHVQDLSRR